MTTGGVPLPNIPPDVEWTKPLHDPDCDPKSATEYFLAGNPAQLYSFDLDALAPLAAHVGPSVKEITTPREALPDRPNEALRKAAVR